MTDQPSQADRERALAWAAARKDLRTLQNTGNTARVLLAIHAENERFRKVLEEFREHGDRDTRFYLGQVLDGTAAQEPKMTETQAETGPSDEAGTSAKAFLDWMDQWAREFPGRNPHIAEAFNAGRASLAGELAEAKQELTELRALYSANAMKRENDGLRAELEAEKAAHGRTKELYDGSLDLLRKAKEYGDRQARVMPSREAILAAVDGACLDASCDGRPVTRAEIADAVLRLLAPTQAGRCDECGDPAVMPNKCGAHAPSGTAGDVPRQPSGASSDPPVPLPEVLPKGSRYTRATIGDLYLRGNGAYTDSDGSRVEAREVDWAHYRAQQAHYVPSVGERAVLVASPGRNEGGWLGKTGTVVRNDDSEKDDPECFWRFTRDGDKFYQYIHRDATWRRAQPQGEAAKCEHREWTAEDDLEDNPSDVGTGAQCDQPATHVGCKPFTGSKTCEKHKCRCAKPIAARPVEPAADPIDLKAQYARMASDLAAIDGKTRGMAEGTAGEFRRVDGTIEALSKRVDALEALSNVKPVRRRGI